MLFEFREVAGVGDFLKVAAEDGGRVVMLGYGDGVESFGAFGDVDVAAHHVHEIGALHEELGHPGVVVAGGGKVAAGAGFGFFGADGVRIVGTETETGKSFGGDGLLHVVEPIAIGILRADDYSAGGAGGRDAVSGDGAIDTQHVNVVAEDFEIVGRIIAGVESFVVEHFGFAIGGHGEMAAETAGGPGGMAGVAGHARVGVGEFGIVIGGAPGPVVFEDRFRVGGGFVVVDAAFSDGVDGLDYFPLQLG